LEASGLNKFASPASGQYVALDAAETLAKFMVDGSPDPGRFSEVIGGIITQGRQIPTQGLQWLKRSTPL
jgi:hypothetical protein